MAIPLVVVIKSLDLDKSFRIGDRDREHEGELTLLRYYTGREDCTGFGKTV